MPNPVTVHLSEAVVVRVYDKGHVSLSNLAGEYFSLSEAAADKLTDALLDRRFRRPVKPRVAVTAEPKKLKWTRDPEAEKVYISLTDEGDFIISPVWSTVYEGKVDGYAVTFKPTDGEVIMIGSRNLGRRYLGGRSERKFGERKFREAKAAAVDYYSKTN